MSEISDKRVSFFIDGQNLFRATKEAFGYQYPNYDVKKLAHLICDKQGWHTLVSIHLYTGMPKRDISPELHNFWRRKLDRMKEEDISVFSRPLYYSKKIINSDGSSKTISIGREKGIDVRLALDVTRAVFEGSCNVAVILSQDQDLSEVAREVRYISKRENRWIKIASAFPVSHISKNIRGIDKTDWIRIDKEMYDECIYLRDYRPKGVREKDVS